MTGTAAIALVLLVIAGEAFSQCVSQLYANNPAASISMNAGNEWVNSGQLADAMSMWANCAQATGGLPDLRVNQSAAIVITVYVTPGNSTSNSGGCAQFHAGLDASGRIDGGAIELFDAQADGGDCEPRRVETIAHEFGHALGLGNSSCLGYIMGPPGVARSVQSDECSQVDSQWTYDDAQDSCNVSCAVPCEGNPPQCPQGGTNEGNDGEGTGCSPWWDCSPLILDLNGDGIHTTGASEPVVFDLTGDGVPERITWTNPQTEEGFLWVDRKHNGRVDDGRELFGVGTVLSTGHRARHGFEALAEYDRATLGGNGDGRISSDDAVWRHLRIWIDEDHDGWCVAPEVGPIAQYGVLAINLSYTVHRQPDENGNYHALRSTFTRRVMGAGGTSIATFAIHDVFFVAVP